MVLKVLCEGAPLPCINWGQGKGWSLSYGGKTEVFQPIALHYRLSELSVGNGIQNRIPATANKWPSDGGATQTCSNQPKMFLVWKYWWPPHLLLLSSTFFWEESSSKKDGSSYSFQEANWGLKAMELPFGSRVTFIIILCFPPLKWWTWKHQLLMWF